MHAAIEAIDFRRHADDLRATWQARALGHASGKLAAVLLSVLAHNFDDAMPVLLRLVFPGFKSITAPFFCSAGRVLKSGQVAADMVTRDGQVIKQVPVFKSTLHLQNAFRRLADALKLSDHDREQMFAAVQRWLVCDFRLDPAMDSADPDAKRLIH